MQKGARAWQDDFVDTLLSKECAGNFLQSLKVAKIFHSSVLDFALDLHVDDGYVTGPAVNMTKVALISSPKLSLSHHQRRQFVSACWSFESDRRRWHEGERVGQVS